MTENNLLLVEVLGDEATIIAQAGKEREFRKITNVYRGASRAVIDKLVIDVRRADDVVSRPVPDNAAASLGTSSFAAPIRGTDNVVYGAHVWTGAGDPPQLDPVGTWEWELGLEGLPPRLRVSEAFLDMFGVAAAHRDRVVYGPADFFSRVVRLSDIAKLWQDIKTAQTGASFSGTFVIRTDEGELRRVHYAQRFIETQAGPRLRGICRSIPTEDQLEFRASLLDTELSRTLIGLQGMFGMVGDVTIPNAPCILKWLTSYVPGIGHGVSTGQTPAIHPDDMGQVVQWINELRDRPASGTVRLRHHGGGWIKAKFIGQLIDPEAFPTIGIALIFPDISTEGVIDVAEPR
jgi:hypothetical protein